MMDFNALPDLTPRDSHILWYTSIRNPHLDASHNDQNQSQPASTDQATANNQQNGSQNNRSRGQPGNVPLERTSLGRLRADEAYMARRLANISNFGSTWLKPPGVGKTLFQMREEKREAEEHAEAMRREQLAADLAQAEAEAAMAAEGDGGMLVPADELSVGQMMEGLEGGRIPGMPGMDEEEDQEDQEVDLDDEIPDADEASGMGYYDDSSDEEEDEEDEDSEEAEEDEIGDVSGLRGPSGSAQRRVVDAARQRMMQDTEDRLRREIMARGSGNTDEDDPYGIAGANDLLDEETQGDILEEDDLLSDDHQHYHHLLDDDGGEGADLDMDANLDDDIPEAESGVYEHTDSDAELSSDDDDDDDDDDNTNNISFGPGGSRAGPSSSSKSAHQASVPRYNNRRSLAGRSDHAAPRSSMVDISSILSVDGSSFLGSSPQVRRRN